MKQSKLISNKKNLGSFLSEWGFSLKGLKTNKNGEWWLIAQLLLIAGHFFPAMSINLEIPIYIRLCLNILSTFILLFGIYIAISSLVALGNNLSPLPEPKLKAVLVTNKIYSFCRHPLYLSLISISISINLFLLSIFHFSLLISLAVILIGKAHSEESRLKRVYTDYNLYVKNTPAIIRGIPLFDWRD